MAFSDTPSSRIVMPVALVSYVHAFSRTGAGGVPWPRRDPEAAALVDKGG